MRRCSLLFGCPAPSGSASCAQRAVRESPAIQSTGAAAVESFLEVEKACPKPRASVSTSSGRSSARESARIVCSVETARACVESRGPQAKACWSFLRSMCRWIVSAVRRQDRKSTRLNSSHGYISYAVFCLKKKKKKIKHEKSKQNQRKTTRTMIHIF